MCTSLLPARFVKCCVCYKTVIQIFQLVPCAILLQEVSKDKERKPNKQWSVYQCRLLPWSERIAAQAISLILCKSGNHASSWLECSCLCSTDRALPVIWQVLHCIMQCEEGITLLTLAMLTLACLLSWVIVMPCSDLDTWSTVNFMKSNVLRCQQYWILRQDDAVSQSAM